MPTSGCTLANQGKSGLVPQTVDDRYELTEVIASGGMATVWRAWDTRLDREVAIKRPHPTAPDDPRHDRILGESRAASAIVHPNVVTVYDAGEDEDGLFLVMELVDGPTLEAAAPAMSDRELVAVGARIGEALAAIHASGIIHRDVKPSNILMSHRGPQLTDFGVAYHPSGPRTAPGTVLTTPEYAAPEVLSGEPATSKSDVFSLAFMLRSLIDPATSVADPAESASPSASSTLAGVLNEALSVNPTERPSADEFATRIAQSNLTKPIAVSDGSTVPMDVVPPPPDQTKARSDSTRPKPWLWLPALALALVALGAILNASFSPDAGTAATNTTTTTETKTTSTLEATTTLATTTTTPEDAVAEARTELEIVLLAIHPNDLKPKDAKAILEKVDDAIRLVSEGETKEATKKLTAASDDIEKKLKGQNQNEASAALEQLADVLGIEVNPGG